MKRILAFLLISLFVSSHVHAFNSVDSLSILKEEKPGTPLGKPSAPPEKKKEEAKSQPKPKDASEHPDLRMEAIEAEAREYGFQVGFSERYKKIQEDCERRSIELDRQYPFDQVLMRDGTVRPPVIVKADDYAELKSPDKLVRTGRAYRILRSAEFVMTPPSWRTYVIIPDEALEPAEPARALLPKTSKERKAWDAAFREAKELGSKSAEEYFEEEMARLDREFLGMIEYHVLERQGKISLPGVNQGHFAVRIGEDTMEIDQQTFVITDRPHFRPQKEWRVHGAPGR